MKTGIAVLIFIGSTMLMRADQLVERVQQTLKDQGFYYGEVSGEMNANVTAAIRRYQIRNGLQVSGELNSETLKSLGIDSSASAQPATKRVSPGPAAPVEPAAGPTNLPVQSRSAGHFTQRRGSCRHPIRGRSSPRATQCGAFGSDRAGPSWPLSRRDQ